MNVRDNSCIPAWKKAMPDTLLIKAGDFARASMIEPRIDGTVILLHGRRFLPMFVKS
jgi:hypothetical protein